MNQNGVLDSYLFYSPAIWSDFCTSVCLLECSLMLNHSFINQWNKNLWDSIHLFHVLFSNVSIFVLGMGPESRYLIILIFSTCLKGRERGKERDLLFTNSFCKCLQWPGLGRPESQAELSLGLPCVWQEPMVCIARKLGLEVDQSWNPDILMWVWVSQSVFYVKWCKTFAIGSFPLIHKILYCCKTYAHFLSLWPCNFH